MDREITKIEIMIQTINEVLNMEKIPIELRESLIASMKFRRELSKESDRGCALLASAHIELLLEKLLKKVLVGNKKHLDSLFSLNGPLCSFFGKTSLAYSLGLISQDAMHDIHIIRKIRNEFGHSPDIISFENETIKIQCDKLKYNVLDSNDKLSRNKFINTIMGIEGFIEILIFENIKIKEAVGIDLKQRKNKFDSFMSTVNCIAEELENENK
jgi:DNA-binding MltR family transcriptional regulator